MGLFQSIGRFLLVALGITESKTNRITQKLLQSPEAVRAAFRDEVQIKTRHCEETREAFTHLRRAIGVRRSRLEKSHERIRDLKNKAQECVLKYQKSQDEKWKMAYCVFIEEAEKINSSLEGEEENLNQLELQATNLKERFEDTREQIRILKDKEESAVADIVVAKQVRRANQSLLQTESHESLLLNAVDEACHLARVQVSVDGELSEHGKTNLQLLEAGLNAEGQRTRIIQAFEEECKTLPAAK